MIPCVKEADYYRYSLTGPGERLIANCIKNDIVKTHMCAFSDDTNLMDEDYDYSDNPMYDSYIIKDALKKYQNYNLTYKDNCETSEEEEEDNNNNVCGSSNLTAQSDIISASSSLLKFFSSKIPVNKPISNPIEFLNYDSQEEEALELHWKRKTQSTEQDDETPYKRSKKYTA